MTSPFSDELISAYLDGELTDQEQARVEKQLGADAGLQRMCDELRALRFLLQGLPTADPADDLAERVLRQAERRILLGKDESADEDLSVRQPAAVPPAPSDPAPRAGQRNWHWRLVASCVATVAALLLVAVMLFQQTGAIGEPDKVASGRRSESSRSVATKAPEVESMWAMDSQPAGGGADGVLDSVRSEGEEEALAPASGRSATEGSEVGGVVGDARRSAASPKVPPRPQEEPARSSDVAASTAYGAAALRSPSASEDAPGARAGMGGAGMGGTGGKYRPGVPSQGVSKPQETDGYGYGREQGDTGLARGASAPRKSSEPSGGSEGLRGKDGDSLAKPAPDGAVDESGGREMYSKSTPSERSFQVTDPAALGSAGAVGAARVAVAQQLVRKLDMDQSLLVQVSLPHDLATRLHLSTVAPVDRLQLSEASKLLDNEGLSQVEVRALSARGEVPLPSIRSQPLENVEHAWVVEGAPEDVRHALQRLVSRSDVLVHSVPTAAGQEPVDLKMFGTSGLEDQAGPSRSQPADMSTPKSAMTADDGVSLAKPELQTVEGIVRKSEPPSRQDKSSGGGLPSGLPRFGTEGEGKGAQLDSPGQVPSEPTAGSAPNIRGRNPKGLKDGPSGESGTGSKSAARAESKQYDERGSGDPIVTGKQDAKKGPSGLPSQSPASQAGQRRGLDRDQDAETLGREQASADGEAGRPDRTVPENMPAIPSSPALSYSARARQSQDVVYFLFRFKAAAATAAPQEAAEAPQGKQ